MEPVTFFFAGLGGLYLLTMAIGYGLTVFRR